MTLIPSAQMRKCAIQLLVSLQHSRDRQKHATIPIVRSRLSPNSRFLVWYVSSRPPISHLALSHHVRCADGAVFVFYIPGDFPEPNEKKEPICCVHIHRPVVLPLFCY